MAKASLWKKSQRWGGASAETVKDVRGGTKGGLLGRDKTLKQGGEGAEPRARIGPEPEVGGVTRQRRRAEGPNPEGGLR